MCCIVQVCAVFYRCALCTGVHCFVQVTKCSTGVRCVVQVFAMLYRCALCCTCIHSVVQVAGVNCVQECCVVQFTGARCFVQVCAVV